MKTKEELNAIKKEVDTLNEDELTQVTGGSIGRMDSVFEGCVVLEKEMNHEIR